MTKKRLLSAAVIMAALLLFLLSAAAFALFAYPNIYPGVSSDGVPLGGMSLARAEQKLAEHITPVLDISTLRVTADGEVFDIRPADIAAKFSARDTAVRALAVARTGGLFRRMGELFSKHDIPLTPSAAFDPQSAARLIGDFAAAFDREPVPYDARYTDTAVIVTVGRAGRRIDKEKLYNAVYSAYKTCDFGDIAADIEYPAPESPDAEALREKIYRPAKNAQLDLSDPQNPTVSAHQTGVSFDAAKLRRALETAEPGASVVIPFEFTEPQISAKDLSDNLFRDTLAQFTTYLQSSNSKRTANISLAAKYIDGAIILPGGEFSFNRTVGERTAERGFSEAGAYVGGVLVPEFGGGVCQMSSTLYNAVLLADMQITERQNHSMTVSYVPPGTDATVNWGTIDFRWKNDKNYPVRIRAQQLNNRLTVTVYGTRETRNRAEIEREQLSRTDPEVIEQVNASLPKGTRMIVQDAHTGYVIQTYRVIYSADGAVVSREPEAKSTYRKADKIIEYN